MEIPKKYFHDKTVLLLATVNVCLSVLSTVLILLRFDPNHGSSYFVQYRMNMGLNAYRPGSYLELLAFMVFAIFVMVLHLVVSMRLYTVRRNYAVIILAAGTLLLTFAIIISNALLVLAH